MIIVVNDKVVQEQMVKEAEEEGGTSVTIPWSAIWGMLLGMCFMVILLYWLMFSRARKSVWKINIDMKDKEGKGDKEEANQEAS